MSTSTQPAPAPHTSRSAGFFASLGAPVVAAGRSTSELVSITLQTFGAIARGAVRGREVVRQSYLIGNRSLFFITVTLGFLGMISVYQIGNQIAQLEFIRDYSMMGAAFLKMMSREFAPTIAGLMIATRVGSGIAAEIGSMVVTEQVDALRMCNADPVQYLVVPRTVACGVMMVMLAIYGVIVAVFAGMLMASSAFDVPFQTFLSLRLIEGSDIIVGLVKAFSYGLAIPIIAGHAGLSASGGSAGVGWATTKAVVNTSFAVVVLDFLLSGLAYTVGL